MPKYATFSQQWVDNQLIFETAITHPGMQILDLTDKELADDLSSTILSLPKGESLSVFWDV